MLVLEYDPARAIVTSEFFLVLYEPIDDVFHVTLVYDVTSAIGIRIDFIS
jgi:hypothetical protein